MTLKRAMFGWWFAAAAVLPLWVLLGYAVWGASLTGFVGVVLLVPVVLVVEAGLALLFAARSSVRRSRVMDAPGVAVLATFQAAVIGFGFFGPATAWFGVLAAIAAIGGAWIGGRLLVRDVRASVQATMAAFGAPPVPPARAPIDAGEYVVLPRR